MQESEMLERIREKALELGAVQAKLIPTKEIVVENRVILKCRLGCDEYGRKLTCPPYAIDVDQFRKMVAEYHWALLLKFRSLAGAGPEVAASLLRTEYDPGVCVERKTEAAQFWVVWKGQKRKILLAVLELERTAFNLGYTLALGFTSGSCELCEKCNTAAGICLHPTMARLPEHAVGINMKATMAKAGIPLLFPFQGHPEPAGLLLID